MNVLNLKVPLAVQLQKDWNPIELISQIGESARPVTVCFVDESPLCARYLANNGWIQSLCLVVVVSQAIIDMFEVSKVPTFQFYRGYEELAAVIGTATQSNIQKTQAIVEAR